MKRQRKLTAEDVAEIKVLVKRGFGPYKLIGKEYGVSAALVCLIVKGKAWKTSFSV